MEFSFTAKAKKNTYILMTVGILLFVIGLFTNMGHGDTNQRVWSSVLINGFFFFAISLGALFFLALQYATEAGWSVVIKRLLEAIMSYLPIGGAVIILVLLVGQFHGHHLYHWMDAEVYKEGTDTYDKIIAGKWAYLNPLFFWARTIIYMATFYIFMKAFRKRSLLEDQVGGTETHFKNYKKAALFLVFFAVFSSTSAWDWIMSIDVHWFSTLFGWYVFSGMWVSAMIFLVVLVLYLKNKGYLEQINDSHIHDLGKWVFAISFLWSYLWFSQFLLIWYSNIPEEVTYYITRIEEYKVLFFGTFIINFVFPMLFFMSRDAKRNTGFLITICLIIFIGHWLDVFLMVTPGTMHGHGSISLLEIGMFLAFLGVFVHVVLKTLTKAPLMPVNHPYLDESLHHDI